MTILDDCISSCCGAKMRVACGKEAEKYNKGITMWHECTKCGKCCDFVENKEKSKQSLEEFQKIIDENK